MTDLDTLAYDLCRCYVWDCFGSLIDAKTRDLVLGWIRSRDIKRLSEACDTIPSAYSTEELCRFSRQVAAFFKKNPAFSDLTRCKAAAKTAFEKAEEVCRITNKRLEHFYFHQDRLPPKLARNIRVAQVSIAETLGDRSNFIRDLPFLIRVTGGASATRSRRHSLPYRKVRFRRLPATEAAKPYLRALASFYGYKRISFADTSSNRVETVPKNWKTDRTIACEPEGNLSLQLACDAFIKKRMKRKLHIDLSDQFRNQRLARESSLSGNYATVDLSMASDSISLNTIHWLFPREWAKLLIDFRSPKGVGFGKQYTYAKLSSMGNGATFAVETLIFAALCKACGSKDFSVYGDDIIIETELYDDLLDLLRFFGFKVNQQKSFSQGPFRESCGADCYLGEDVTPFYLRATSSMKVELCHIVNGMASLSRPGGQLCNYLLSLIRERNLPLIPWNYSSISGVWISPHLAYDQRLIRARDCIPKVLALTPKAKVRRVRDSRAYFLWHLQAAKRSRGEISTSSQYLNKLYYRAVRRDTASQCIESTLVSTFTHRYVRKWVGWFPPAEVAPDHLYWWSDLVIRCKADN